MFFSLTDCSLQKNVDLSIASLENNCQTKLPSLLIFEHFTLQLIIGEFHWKYQEKILNLLVGNTTSDCYTSTKKTRENRGIENNSIVTMFYTHYTKTKTFTNSLYLILQILSTINIHTYHYCKLSRYFRYFHQCFLFYVYYLVT